MGYGKQVDRSHYDFGTYVGKGRWVSLWHQLDELTRLQPDRALEIGPGPGLFKRTAAVFGIRVETIDHDPELGPNCVGSALALPFADNAYPVVCAFQVLEHLPYTLALQAFAEMVRVSSQSVLISLPDSRPVWRFQFHVPAVGSYDFSVPRPLFRRPAHQFDGEHYWEIDKMGYELQRVIADFGAGCSLERTYRVTENPYHRFMVFKKAATAP